MIARASGKRWLGYVVGLLAVVGLSVFIGSVLSVVQLTNLFMLYLLAVLPVAIFFGRGPAIFVSLVAFITFNWFFIQPLHTLTIANPAEWVALLLFFITAVTTAQVAAGERRRAIEAEQREREAAVLYDVVRLMSGPDLRLALSKVAERLRRELALEAVVIEAAHGRATTAAAVGEERALEAARLAGRVPTDLLGEGPGPTDESRGAPGRWIRVRPPHPPNATPAGPASRLLSVPVKVGDRRVGAITLVRSAGTGHLTKVDDRLLSAVATQLGTAVESARLRLDMIDAEVLRQADELKSALLNAVSHDLRTPLASIIASASSLRQQDVPWTEDDKQEFATAIEEEALRLNQIVGNLLDLSRMEGGTLRPEKGWYDVGELVDDVLGRLRPITAGHSITVNVDGGLPPAYFDYVEVDQVLSNLIENACKYAPAGTEVTVVARREGDNLRLEVADRGPGIPPAALPRLFEPFYRVEAPGPRPQGTGLGLAVAKGLVVAHGGRIWAQNRAGGGASFIFTLPIGAAAQAVPAAEGREA